MTVRIIERLSKRHTESVPTVADGQLLGRITRRYGLMQTIVDVRVCQAFEQSADLAVADRYAFMRAVQTQTTVVVIDFEGTWTVCSLDQALDVRGLTGLTASDGAPRIMTIATSRGIVPCLGPLVPVAG